MAGNREKTCFFPKKVDLWILEKFHSQAILCTEQGLHQESYFSKELSNTILIYLMGRGENDDNEQSYLIAELKFPKFIEYMNCHIIWEIQ